MKTISPDPFNCSDPCHLTWLLRDHPYLMKKIAAAENKPGRPSCSNGTYFDQLYPKALFNCTSVIHKGCYHKMCWSKRIHLDLIQYQN